MASNRYHLRSLKLYAHIWLLKTYTIPASMYAIIKKIRGTVLVAVALSIFVGSGDLCWLCMVIRRPASPSPLHVSLARGVCASGLCGSRTGPRGPPSPAAAEQWFSTFWGPPSGPPPPSLPLLSSLGHLGVQQQL